MYGPDNLANNTFDAASDRLVIMHATHVASTLEVGGALERAA